MKSKAFCLIAIENGIPEEVAESDSWKRLMNRAIREMKPLVACFNGNVTWHVVEKATDRIWFHIGCGEAQNT